MGASIMTITRWCRCWGKYTKKVSKVVVEKMDGGTQNLCTTQDFLSWLQLACCQIESIIKQPMLTSQRAKDIGIPNLKRWGRDPALRQRAKRQCLVQMANRETDPKTFLQASTSCSMDWCSWGCSWRWVFHGRIWWCQNDSRSRKSWKIHENPW